jgi:hypothetical protein
MATGISFYIVPAIFSVLMTWSLRKIIKERQVLTKVLISFILAFLAIMIYTLGHSVFNEMNHLKIIKIFGYGNLIASLVITFINLVALWAFFKVKRIS